MREGSSAIWAKRKPARTGGIRNLRCLTCCPLSQHMYMDMYMYMLVYLYGNVNATSHN